MQTHSQFAANKLIGCNSKEAKIHQWERLAGQISAQGPTKTVKQVKDVSEKNFFSCFIKINNTF